MDKTLIPASQSNALQFNLSFLGVTWWWLLVMMMTNVQWLIERYYRLYGSQTIHIAMDCNLHFKVSKVVCCCYAGSISMMITIMMMIMMTNMG